MAEVKQPQTGAGIPLFSVEDPEVVRLKIAQDNLERLIEMKQHRITAVVQKLEQLCDKFENEVSQIIYDRETLYELLAYAETLEIYALPINVIKENIDLTEMGHNIGVIRAKLSLWHQKQLEEIEAEISRLLLKT